MKFKDLQKLGKKLYFGVDDVVQTLEVTPQSARVLCSRYVKEGIFIRLKNNFYVLAQNWAPASRDYFLRLANFLQVPSYISFMSALSLYEVTTQVQRGFFESASLKRSRKFSAHASTFVFYKLQKGLYFDFTKKQEIFIASREKAFLDAVYLYSFGKYRLDFASLDLAKLDMQRIKEVAKPFPEKTRAIVSRLCKI